MEELGSDQSNGPERSVGQTAWRPYAPTGVRSYDDDDDCIPTAKCSLVLVSSPGVEGGGGLYSPIYGF